MLEEQINSKGVKSGKVKVKTEETNPQKFKRKIDSKQANKIKACDSYMIEKPLRLTSISPIEPNLNDQGSIRMLDFVFPLRPDNPYLLRFNL